MSTANRWLVGCDWFVAGLPAKLAVWELLTAIAQSNLA
jgi:hypothetical protein